jgi:hypothetical protein
MNKQNFLGKTVFAAILMALVAPAALKAQSDEIRFGVGVSLVNPIGSFGDISGLGFGGSFSAELPLSDFQAVRGRAEYNSFGKKDWTPYGSTSASAMSAIVEYVFKFGSDDTGLYVFGGFGLVNRKSTVKLDGVYGHGEWSSSKVGLVYSYGGGYNLTTNLGVEACLNHSTGKLESDYVTYPAFSWLQVAARWRF